MWRSSSTIRILCDIGLILPRDQERPGEAQAERGALAVRAVGGRDRDAHRLGESFHDGKAEPGPAGPVAARDPREAVERAAAIGKAGPLVFHGEENVPAVLPRHDPDRRALAG